MGLKYVGFLFPFPLSGCCDEFLLIEVMINEFEYFAWENEIIYRTVNKLK